jgi:acyl carrier protein
LEIALAISMKYGFQIRSDDNDNSKIFASLRSLSQHVGENRVK